MGHFGIAQAYTFHACKSEQCRHHPWQSLNSTLQRRALPTFERRLNIGTPQNLHCYHLLSFERLATQMQNKVTQTLSAYLILDRLFASVCYVFLCKWVETCTGYWIKMYWTEIQDGAKMEYIQSGKKEKTNRPQDGLAGSSNLWRALRCTTGRRNFTCLQQSWAVSLFFSAVLSRECHALSFCFEAFSLELAEIQLKPPGHPKPFYEGSQRPEGVSFLSVLTHHLIRK